MEPYQERVIEEKRELDVQREAMAGYSLVLMARIKLFEKTI